MKQRIFSAWNIIACSIIPDNRGFPSQSLRETNLGPRPGSLDGKLKKILRDTHLLIP